MAASLPRWEACHLRFRRPEEVREEEVGAVAEEAEGAEEVVG